MRYTYSNRYPDEHFANGYALYVSGIYGIMAVLLGALLLVGMLVVRLMHPWTPAEIALFKFGETSLGFLLGLCVLVGWPCSAWLRRHPLTDPEALTVDESS